MEPKLSVWESKDFWKDGAERVVSSFVLGVIGVLLVDYTDGKLDTPWSAVIAGGVIGALSAVKAVIGAMRKDTTTPVSLF